MNSKNKICSQEPENNTAQPLINVELRYPVIRWNSKVVKLTAEKYQELVNSSCEKKTDFIISQIEVEEEHHYDSNLINGSVDVGYAYIKEVE